MPTLRRFAWTLAGNSGRSVGWGVAGWLVLLGDPVKKEVIWRWAGSAAAPANWRLVRGFMMGDDIVEDEDDEISCIEDEAAKLQEKLYRGGRWSIKAAMGQMTLQCLFFS